MPYSPTGALALALIDLRTALAALPAFQAWAGVGDATAAQAHIHLVAAPITAPRPLVLLDLADGIARERVMVATGRFALTTLPVLLHLTAVAQGDPGESELRFLDALDGILAELEQLDLELAATSDPGPVIFFGYEIANAPQRVAGALRQKTGTAPVDEITATLALSFGAPQ